jgi:hypothetical protein
VSGCTHTDRELTLVPKKGRPITQCAHCRQERKKRSAHVGCECGDVQKPHHPKEKCIHLREAEERAKLGFHSDHPLDSIEQNAAHLAAAAKEQGCCCPHGGKCTCAMLKKEAEKDKSVTPPHGPAVKPRLESTKSDGHLTVFQNGHHKPVHRKNHAAHECGMPYKMPLPRMHTDSNLRARARRSVDSLALDSNMQANPSPFASQGTPLSGVERRLSKSEQHSPKMSCAMMGDRSLSNLDFTNLVMTITNQSQQSAVSSAFDFAQAEPLSGVAESSYDPWSAFPSADSMNMPNNNPFGVWPTNVDANGMAQPALTAASSGTQSEIDEMPPMDDLYGFGMPSIQEDVGNFDGTMGLGSPGMNRRSLPADFKPIDFMSPSLAAEWQQSSENGQPFSLGDPWQTTSGSNKDPYTPEMGGLPLVSRPASRSVGMATAPNDDMLRQLFPEIDVEGNMYCSPNGQNEGSNPTPSSNFGAMDDNLEFSTRQWTDGSITVPNDGYSSAFELNQDFANPDFTANWSQ